ncbi:hypothetical protein HELRODRAFT_167700 [Helobdella robusta]|uniref:HMG box domain-containing protein n=1 Tax=Helobdella robusta TaxID=6412 RepID=T1EZP6_HELRO|nr:hypothetical protein HELRODRAFT_167700 [Helobdella robusta]ESO09883.1 hypothetical protein HELRODRAFT_167700 [Helobdella robusta]
MSVCEIGATIGRMWRELSNEDKQRHNDDFTVDKVRYDSELKQYLKDTGLRSRDLIKIRAKNKAAAKSAARRPAQPQQAVQHVEGAHSDNHPHISHNNSNSQFGQSIFPIGMPVSMLPGFPNIWGSQQYASQQQMFASMQLAQQQNIYFNHQNFDSYNHMNSDSEPVAQPPSSMYL